MKVRIKPYMCKDEATRKPVVKYRVVILTESIPESGNFDTEGAEIGRDYLSEGQAEEAALLYKNKIYSVTDNDIDI